MASRQNVVWTGWVAFAAIMLVFVGMLNLFEGIVALVQDERLVITPSNLVVVDLTAWGWTLVASGAVMMATGFGLLMGQTWARIAGIVVVGLHGLIQVAWLGAYPIWSLLMIALDTVVIFALTARWSEARERLAYGTDESWATPGASTPEGSPAAREAQYRPRPIM
jgi:hypothetical protein